MGRLTLRSFGHPVDGAQDDRCWQARLCRNRKSDNGLDFAGMGRSVLRPYTFKSGFRSKSKFRFKGEFGFKSEIGFQARI